MSNDTGQVEFDYRELQANPPRIRGSRFCSVCGSPRKRVWKLTAFALLLAMAASACAIYFWVQWSDAADSRDSFAARLFDADQELRAWNADPSNPYDDVVVFEVMKKRYPGVDVHAVWIGAVETATAELGQNHPQIRERATELFHVRCALATTNKRRR